MTDKKRVRKNNLVRSRKVSKWPEILAILEEKIGRTDLKRAQLVALRAVFKRQQAAGDPTPFEIAAQK